MDTTIRNLEQDLYRALKAKAALEGRTIGELVNEAIEVYLSRQDNYPKTSSLRDLRVLQFPLGDQDLSERIDQVIYDSGEDS
jgi:plasmid stability protein